MLLAPHQPKNRLYYDGSQHDAYALSASEQVTRIVNVARSICCVHAALRLPFHGCMMRSTALTPQLLHMSAGAADGRAAQSDCTPQHALCGAVGAAVGRQHPREQHARRHRHRQHSRQQPGEPWRRRYGIKALHFGLERGVLYAVPAGHCVSEALSTVELGSCLTSVGCLVVPIAGVPQYGGVDPGDYGRLATPSMTPGAGGESPFMTWGDIAGATAAPCPADQAQSLN